jgi:hypothetical protein
MMLRKFLLVAVVLSLFMFALPAQAQDTAPLWHCDAVTVAQSSPGWNVTATGAGAYWRVILRNANARREAAGLTRSQAERACVLAAKAERSAR